MFSLHFTAIMEDYAVENNTQFCWGLPLQHFSLALPWANRVYYDPNITPLRRRMHGSTQRFPSWSWAGWVGVVSLTCMKAQSISALNIDPRGYLAMGYRIRHCNSKRRFRNRHSDCTG
jgi:hypothetical protein